MSTVDYRYVYRAHVTPELGRDCEHTVYVEAYSHKSAIDKITAAVSAMQPFRKDVAEAIYNCTSAAECIEQGENDDHLVRLFEVGWGGGRDALICRNPIFLLPDSGTWARIWSAARYNAGEHKPAVASAATRERAQ